MNRWHVYEAMKSHWRKTGNTMKSKDLIAKFPGIEFTELVEGIVEFELAYERSFSKEAVQDLQEENVQKHSGM